MFVAIVKIRWVPYANKISLVVNFFVSTLPHLYTVNSKGVVFYFLIGSPNS